MSQENPEFLSAIDYIMKRATSREITIIRKAIEARSSSSPETMEDLNFRDMAQKLTKDIAEKYGVENKQGEIHGMTRRLVRNAIKNNAPEISDRDLEVLIDQWVDKPKQSHQGKEGMLPPDMVLSMVDQFVRYSLNMMQEAEIRELKTSYEDWVNMYWDIFSMETKHLIKALLEAKMDMEEFYSQVRMNLDRQRS